MAAGANFATDALEWAKEKTNRLLVYRRRILHLFRCSWDACASNEERLA